MNLRTFRSIPGGGERPNLNGKQVIDHYNWVWQNMIPTKGRIVIEITNDVLIQLYHKN